MSDAPALVYLEADDEITSVVRRLRSADPGRVVIVAPGRSRATSSLVALRLLARAADEADREVAVVGDGLTRSLAAEAGLATYASVDDARTADPSAAAEPAEVRTAPIHVVRGPVTDETAPTMAAVAALSETTAEATSDAETRVVAVARPTPQPRQPSTTSRATALRPARPRPSWAAALAGLAIVVGAWGVLAAIILPAATITIAPRTEAIEPATDVVVVDEPDRIAGTAEAAATVTATGSYEINEPATGSVVFFNFNFFDAEVPAGSLVATGAESGDQAFATGETIVVPAGSFDPIFGGITAGEAPVGVTAAATGEGGNVAAEAIDTVLDPGLAAQLRGFPSITERLVTNPEAASGGVATSGAEITQEDVDAAVAELREALQDQVETALAATGSAPFADAGEPAEPQISGTDGLVGTRDADTTEISGTLAYDRLVADRAAVEAEAIERFASDPATVPEGWQLVDGGTAVDIGEARRSGDGLEVDVTVTGRAAPMIDADDVVARSTGLSVEDAEAALAELGAASVEVWPGWVSTVPGMAWRVEVRIVDPEAEAP